MFLALPLLECSDGSAPPAVPTAPTTPVTPVTPAPALANPNVVVGITAGDQCSYDATKGGTAFSGATGALTYRIAFDGAANGLSAIGGTVVGQSLGPGVAWATITATDAAGRSASDRFAIVTFARGLTTPTLPVSPYRYSDAGVPLPAHFFANAGGPSVSSTDNTPADNPITDAGAALGRVLFYDARVSANDGLSCAGCHNPSVAFSDTPQRSVGFAGGFTGRHSPALVNARFYAPGRFFWDERAATLEAQVLRPIQDGTEMGMSLDNLVAKVRATPYYPPLFSAAFGSPDVSSDRIARALAQYVRSLVSTNSRFDRAFGAAGPPNFAAVFTPQEVAGEALFRASGCAACHTTTSQVSDAVHNTGLDLVSTDTGAGRGRFKAPSLRNVAVRPRFMHDGRFTSLEQVIEFYDSGVQPNPDLDPRLRAPTGPPNGPPNGVQSIVPRRLNLTTAQKASLVAFLNTLTDSTFLTAERFADPFVPAAGAPVSPPATPSTPATPPSAPPTLTASVIIRATAYNPATITVSPGTVITWMNLDNTRHSASFASPLAGSTPIFTSGGQSLAMPTTPGTYTYQCAVHGAAMRGTVVVR